MNETRYEYIKEHFPVWAEEVESDARVLYRNLGDEDFAQYVRGLLEGLAEAARKLGMIGDADEFVDKAKDLAFGIGWEVTA